MADPNSIAQTFEHFAANCHDSSPLYARLALEIARDPELLALAGYAPRRQPAPNLLFAAVRFLLLKGLGSGTLAEFQSIDNFRYFCRAHSAEIHQILATRRVQTNEVGRCSYLFPAFVSAAMAMDEQALDLIEIGTSAGLLLNWDHYAYQYNDGEILGDRHSTVQLKSEVRGRSLPPLRPKAPAVSSRLGIDLHTIDVRDEAERLWLQSLVWPEQTDRACILEAAIELQRAYPVRLVGGDGLDLLPAAITELSGTGIPCVFHTATLNQLSAEDRAYLSDVLAELGKTRNLVWISAELGSMPLVVALEMTIWRNGSRYHHVLARAHPHGRWLEWLEGQDL
jgi:hypothetical protein